MVRKEEKPDTLGFGRGLDLLFWEGAASSQQGQVRWNGAGENRDSTLCLNWAKKGERENCSPDSRRVKPVVRGL